MVSGVDVLLFDEPLANLDPAAGKKAVELIDEIQKRTGCAVIIIEHRLEDVLWRNVDRIILVNEGTILADLRPDELLMVDDLKPGYDMCRACGVPFAAAGWANDVPEIERFMRENCDFYFKTVKELDEFLQAENQ